MTQPMGVKQEEKDLEKQSLLPPIESENKPDEAAAKKTLK